MSDTLDTGGRRLFSGLAPREWSLRRKVALAVLIPIALAAVFGGLRVRNDLAEADSYSASAKQVTVLRPAVDYLAAAEAAVVVARERTSADDPDRDAAVEVVKTKGEAFAAAVESAGLTAAQRKQADSVYDLSEQLRSERAYLSAGGSLAQLRTLQRGVSALIATIVEEQIEPEPRLQLLDNVLSGRISLAIQQFTVAYNDGAGVKPVELAAEVGVEASAIDRISTVLGTTDADVAALRSQNAAHFGAVREGGTDLGDETAYAPYDRLSTEILDGIDKTLADAADESQGDALIDSAITVAALLAAIFLALLVSRLLLDPIRRVREGALEVAQFRLPEAVRTIRAGGDPGEIVPIDVTTHEEMGQLARAVDSLHQEAVDLAAGEAKLREQVGEMFVTLSRRSTSLINQQLGLIEKLEKDEEDPKRLESLFRLDHLASRMRRTADSLNVLADAPAGSSDPHGLSVSDVLQAALAGVQEYQRVQIEADATERVSGAAASDTVHMVTELIDNALAYSPPTSTVSVTTKQSPEGVVIKVSDAGLGMKDDAMAALNEDLRSGGEVNAETARRMGLLVVSRIAQRHGILVELERNSHGGVTASVVLPTAILRRAGESPQPLQPVPAPAPTSALAAFTGVPDTDDAVEPTETAETEEAAEAVEPVPAVEPPAAVRQPAPVLGAATPAPALPIRQRTGEAPSPAGSLASRLQSMREAREAANLGPSAVPKPTPAATTAATAASTPAAEPTETDSPGSIEAAINAVIRLPQRRPGAAEVPGAITPLSAEPPTPVETSEPVATAPEVVEREAPAAEVVEPEVLEPEVVEPVSSAPEPVVPAPSPIPTATTSFSVLDAQSPMPELAPEEGSIFASLRSNWFNAEGPEQPWSGNEVDSGWEAADRVAEATPLQVSEKGLPVRRPGARIVPGGVTPAPAALVRDPEAIRARLAAHAAGVNRGRRLAGGPQAAEALTVDPDHSEHSQEVDPS
jgi:signal transduction histidine kinase